MNLIGLHDGCGRTCAIIPGARCGDVYRRRTGRKPRGWKTLLCRRCKRGVRGERRAASTIGESD